MLFHITACGAIHRLGRLPPHIQMIVMDQYGSPAKRRLFHRIIEDYGQIMPSEIRHVVKQLPVLLIIDDFMVDPLFHRCILPEKIHVQIYVMGMFIIYRRDIFHDLFQARTALILSVRFFEINRRGNTVGFLHNHHPCEGDIVILEDLRHRYRAVLSHFLL